MKKATIFSNFLELILFPFSIPLVAVSFFLFDAPGSEKNPLLGLIVLLIASYPIILITSLLLSRKYYKREEYKMSFWLSFVPVMPALLMVILFIIMQIYALIKLNGLRSTI